MVIDDRDGDATIVDPAREIGHRGAKSVGPAHGFAVSQGYPQ